MLDDLIPDLRPEEPVFSKTSQSSSHSASRLPCSARSPLPSTAVFVSFSPCNRRRSADAGVITINNLCCRSAVSLGLRHFGEM